jgi:Leucine-rich repeat (LRR) protein
MSNLSNIQVFQPRSLFDQTASVIIRGNLQNVDSLVELKNKTHVNTKIKEAWDALKNYPKNCELGSDFGLRQIMEGIEDSLVAAEQEEAISQSHQPFSTVEEREALLKSRVNTLFIELAKEFQTDKLYKDAIPLDLSSYARLQRKWEDEALQIIWDSNLKKRLVFNDLHPEPTDLDGIRAYLKDPTNATRLSQIDSLIISDLGLRAIPSEIKTLPRLRHINLGRNAIHNIPDALTELVNLQLLCLDNNHIYTIPDSLGKLVLLQDLDLSYNKISCIPDSLGKLVQLRELKLLCNRISCISDSIGELANLKRLNLFYNKISIIPDAIASLTQLTHLSLNENQIHAVPDSLAKCNWLVKFSLDGNQINTIPDSLITLLQRKKFSVKNNPFLFILSMDDRDTSNEVIIKKCSELKKYKCLSAFSSFCYFMIFRNCNLTFIKGQFATLKPEDQSLISELILDELGLDFDDPIKKKQSLFDNMNLFYRLVGIAIREKFSCLSEQKKLDVYKEVYRLANPEIKDVKKWQEWAKAHLYDNVLLLVDALDKA